MEQDYNPTPRIRRPEDEEDAGNGGFSPAPSHFEEADAEDRSSDLFDEGNFDSEEVSQTPDGEAPYHPDLGRYYDTLSPPSLLREDWEGFSPELRSAMEAAAAGGYEVLKMEMSPEERAEQEEHERKWDDLQAIDPSVQPSEVPEDVPNRFDGWNREDSMTGEMSESERKELESVGYDFNDTLSGRDFRGGWADVLDSTNPYRFDTVRYMPAINEQLFEEQRRERMEKIEAGLAPESPVQHSAVPENAPDHPDWRNREDSLTGKVPEQDQGEPGPNADTKRIDADPHKFDMTREKLDVGEFSKQSQARMEALKADLPEGPTLSDMAGYSAEGFTQGVSRGWSDEIAGTAAAVAKSAADGSLDNIKEYYEKVRNERREHLQEAREKAPVTAYASEILGSLISPVKIGPRIIPNAPLAQRAAGAMKNSVMTGALYGAGTGEGSGIEGAVDHAVKVGAGMAGGWIGQKAGQMALGRGLASGGASASQIVVPQSVGVGASNGVEASVEALREYYEELRKKKGMK